MTVRDFTVYHAITHILLYYYTAGYRRRDICSWQMYEFMNGSPRVMKYFQAKFENPGGALEFSRHISDVSDTVKLKLLVVLRSMESHLVT